MSFNDNLPKLKPFKRSVSIIGVGATPFVRILDDPSVDGMNEQELFAYAARDAMKDAGVDGSDVEFYIHGQAGPGWTSNLATPNMHVANWIGMKGKGSYHHSEACATGYVGVETAVALVASGEYDMVLSGCIETPYSIAYPTRVVTKRRFGTDAIFHDVLASTQCRDYTLFTRGSLPFNSESWLDYYVKENGISEEDVDAMMTALSVNCRRAAALNPLSTITNNTYEELAATNGMDSAYEYLHSKFNPLIGKYMRGSHFEQRCDGAAAIIVCPTELAYKYTDHPIEILGIGHSNVEAGNPRNEMYATQNAYRQVKQVRIWISSLQMISTISLNSCLPRCVNICRRVKAGSIQKKAVLLMMETVRSIQMVAVASMVMQQVLPDYMMCMRQFTRCEEMQV
jgi:acetyl-CoA C-acetyltransferase